MINITDGHNIQSLTTASKMSISNSIMYDNGEVLNAVNIVSQNVLLEKSSISASALHEEIFTIVQRDTIERLIQAFVREHLVKYQYDSQNKKLVIQLEKTPGALIIAENVTVFFLNRYRISGTIMLRYSEGVTLINNVEQFLEILNKEMLGKANSQGWEAFVNEVRNSIQNLILVKKSVAAWYQQIEAAAVQYGYKTLWHWIKDKKAPVDTTLFFEQFAHLGHPYYPGQKIRLGFSEEDVINYTPEFRNFVNIHLAALDKTQVQLEYRGKKIEDYVHWFSETYPQWWDVWANKLKALELNAKNYVPFPIHPWQQQHVIPNKFHALIEQGKLHLFTDVNQVCYPTLSTRTLTVEDGKNNLLHIKLPLTIKVTSVVRDLPASSISSNLIISQILNNVVKQENYFNHTLRVLDVHLGLHVAGNADDETKDLSVLFRENPNLKISQNEIAIVAAALFSESPISHLPLAIELMQVAGVNGKDKALNYFQQYVEIVLKSHLDLYLIYGIALEGHQQNTIVIFEDGLLKAIIARDCGDVGIQKNVLIQRGFNYSLALDDSTFTEDLTLVRNILLHTAYQLHLGEMVRLIANYYSISEASLWQIIEEGTKQRFAAIKERIGENRWQEEYKAILENGWPLKAFLSSQFKIVREEVWDAYVALKNPFVQSHEILAAKESISLSTQNNDESVTKIKLSRGQLFFKDKSEVIEVKEVEHLLNLQEAKNAPTCIQPISTI